MEIGEMNADSDSKDDPQPQWVVMPWEDKTEIQIESDSCQDKIVKRWNYIQTQLSESKQILNVADLTKVIKSYNVKCDETGRQLSPPWTFSALVQYFNEIDKRQNNEFFEENGTLSTIRNLALQSVDVVPKVKLLRSGYKSCVTLHQLQIASLLANAFLCTFPKRDPGYPSINFDKLFEGSEKGNSRTYVEKIKCIIHYFRRISEKQPTGNISFHRLCIRDHKLPRWDKTTASLCGLKVEIHGRIEEQEGFLQMDFANRFVGGGVLGRGCVQEEIRFVICPELIAARLFTQCLADNEALFVVGAERYCKYTGFASTFRFVSDYRDATPFDETNHRQTYLIVIDALYFSNSSEQYRESKILRELKKAYVGFKPMPKTRALPVVTGNWGCGAFHGDPQLKSVLQLMASSQARRDILYLTFGDSSLKKQIDDLYKLLKEREINVGTLYRIIRLYSRNKNKNQSLFDFIHDTIANYKKHEFASTSSLSSVSSTLHVQFSAIDPTARGSAVGDWSSTVETSCSRKCDERDDCGNMVKRIKMVSVSNENEGPRQTETDALSQERSVPVVVEVETKVDGDGNDSPSGSDVEMTEVPSSSPALINAAQKRLMMMMQAVEEKRSDPGQLSESPGQRHKIFAEPAGGDDDDDNASDNRKVVVGDVTPRPRKLVQSKITDCFFRKQN